MQQASTFKEQQSQLHVTYLLLQLALHKVAGSPSADHSQGGKRRAEIHLRTVAWMPIQMIRDVMGQREVITREVPVQDRI